MSAACRASPTRSTTPSSSWARPIFRCRTTRGALGRRPTSLGCTLENGVAARADRRTMTLDRDEIAERLAAVGYVADRDIATALWLMDFLKRPLLLEGEAGVGKTEVAKSLAAVHGTELIRLQCYEGLDQNAALYEWNYQR